MSRSRGRVARHFQSLPRTKNAREQWERDVDRCWMMLDEIHNVDAENSEAWKRGMIKHWEDKLRDLTDNKVDRDWTT